MAQAMDKEQGKRRPVDPMRHHRENGWDYKGRAIYHFTLPVEERFPLFGTLDGESAETAFGVPQGQVTDMLMLMVGHNRVRPLCALPFEKT